MDQKQGEQMGTAIHSQVRKIKEEFSEKVVDYWLPAAGKPEMMRRQLPVPRESTSAPRAHRISRSPLGISGRPISVGD